MAHHVSQACKRFFTRDDGNVTVEFVLWFPFVFLFLASSVDISMLFYQQQTMYDEAYSSARQVSLGLNTPEATATEAETRLSDGSDAVYTASVTTENGYVTSEITVSFEDVTLFVGTLAPSTLVAKATLFQEVIPQ